MYIYCVKCRKKVYVLQAELETLKKGRSKVAMEAWSGICPKCGTKVYRIYRKVGSTNIYPVPKRARRR